MAEIAGAPHNDECASATGEICVCSCRGTLHGARHRRGRAARIVRAGEVTITATTQTGEVAADVRAGGATTPAQRQKHPVTVTVVQTDSPIGATSTVGDGPEVTSTVGASSSLPRDLSGHSDDDLMRLFADLSEQGREDDLSRLWAEMGRREEAQATADRYALPADVSALSDDALDDQFTQASATGDESAIGVLYAEMGRRESAAAERRAAHSVAPTGPAYVTLANAAWTSLKDPDYVYRTLGLFEGQHKGAPEGVPERAALAERLALGLPADATDDQVRAAEHADPRDADDRAGMYFAWYRQLATVDGIDPGDEARFGPPDSNAERARADARAAERAAADAKRARDQARAAAIADGPTAPVRVRNPASTWAGIRSGIDSYAFSPAGKDAQERYHLAQTRALGLPDDASPADVKAAAKADPRNPGERIGSYLAWYRLIGANSDTGNSAEWAVGPADEPGVDAPPKTLVPANVVKAWDVWQTIRDQAKTDMAAGDASTWGRYVAAMKAGYGLPSAAEQDDITIARRFDERTNAQQAAAFIAAYRQLAEVDGVDRNDPLRYGPPDRGAGKKRPTQWAEPNPEQEQQLERLLARGWDYLDAYAEVHGMDADRLRAQRSEALVDRRAGESREDAIRRSYDQHVHLQWMEAETATRGHLLSPAGKAAGVDPLSLFSGPTATARKYASEDLLRWWADHGGRVTYGQFKARVTGSATDRAAARKTAMAAQGKDFG